MLRGGQQTGVGLALALGCRVLSWDHPTHLALEHVAQVAAALGTGDLGALHAKGAVDVAVHRPRDLVVERRPVPRGTRDEHSVQLLNKTAQ